MGLGLGIRNTIIHIISLYANVSSLNALLRRSLPVDVSLSQALGQTLSHHNDTSRG